MDSNDSRAKEQIGTIEIRITTINPSMATGYFPFFKSTYDTCPLLPVTVVYDFLLLVNKLFSVITINPRQTRRIPTANPCAGLLSLKYFIDVVKVLKLTDVPKNTGTAYALIELANTSKNVLSIAGATIGSVILVKILLLGVLIL